MHISLLVLFYVLIVDNIFRPLDSLVLISSIGFYFMYGFLINDFFDMPYDIAADKLKKIQELPKNKFVKIIIIVIFISVLHILYLREIGYVITYIISFILATLYSAPPIRFKSRGFSGIVVNGLIEKMLPVLAVFAYFNHFGADTIIFLAASFFIHLSEIITHQIHDYESDLKTKVYTFVVDIGIDKAVKIFKNFIAPITASLMILLSLHIIIKIPYAAPIAALVVITYTVLYLLISRDRLNRAEHVFPLYMACLNFLLNSAFPLFLAFIFVLKYPLNIALLLIALYSQYYRVKNLFSILRRNVILREDLTDL